VRLGGVDVPLAALIGAPLTAAIFVLAMVTHEGARYAGPAWLLIGLVVYAGTRVRERKGMFEDVDPRPALPVGASFRRILVPMKLGDIGEEMVATAVALAKESGATIEAITVVQVPRERELGAPLPPDVAAEADASVAEAQALGEENGVDVRAEAVHARSIGHAIVDEAASRSADLIVLGSSPRWRRQSRFFSPTVDHVLRHAPCEVLVVAFPEGVFDE
jgi:nucleotide-binding universal stress UspA family protein